MISTASVPVKKSELKNLSDDQLMALVAANSNEALGMLMQRYEQKAKAFARKLVTDDYLTDEIVNKAFTCIWTHRHNFSQLRGTFKPWMMQIVRNLGFNAIRDRKRKDAPCTSLEELRDLEQLPSRRLATSSAETVAISRITKHEIITLLNQIPKRYRLTMLLWVETQSGEEVASTLRIPPGTVRSRVHRAKAFLSQMPAMREIMAA